MHILFIPNHKWLYRALAEAMFTEVLERDHQQPITSLEWRHNGLDSASNHQPRECLFDRLFRRRSKKTSKLRVTGLYEGNSPGTGEFPTQMASYAENVSIWWRHHDRIICFYVSMQESNVTRLVDQHRKWLTSSCVVIVFCYECIEARAKWSPFYKRNFQIHFRWWKMLYSCCNFT